MAGMRLLQVFGAMRIQPEPKNVTFPLGIANRNGITRINRRSFGVSSLCETALVNMCGCSRYWIGPSSMSGAISSGRKSASRAFISRAMENVFGQLAVVRSPIQFKAAQLRCKKSSPSWKRLARVNEQGALKIITSHMQCRNSERKGFFEIGKRRPPETGDRRSAADRF